MMLAAGQAADRHIQGRTVRCRQRGRQGHRDKQDQRATKQRNHAGKAITVLFPSQMALLGMAPIGLTSLARARLTHPCGAGIVSGSESSKVIMLSAGTLTSRSPVSA